MPNRELVIEELPGNFGWVLKWSDKPYPLATSTEKWVLDAAVKAHEETQKRGKGCTHDTDGDGNCPIHPLGCPESLAGAERELRSH